MTTQKQVEPALYVGTYAKYNNGDISGAWLKLSDYIDRDDFEQACRDLHKDESDPEIMFQDFEGFPAAWYCEAQALPELWDFLRLPAHERAALCEYLSDVVPDGTLTDFQDDFMGQFASWSDFVSEQLDCSGILEQIPPQYHGYFHLQAYSNDLRAKYTMTASGYVFSTS